MHIGDELPAAEQRADRKRALTQRVDETERQMI